MTPSATALLALAIYILLIAAVAWLTRHRD